MGGSASERDLVMPVMDDSNKGLKRRLGAGVRNGGMNSDGMGAMMAFMGLPYLSRGFEGRGSMGPMQRILPLGMDPASMADDGSTTDPTQPPNNGGGTDPNAQFAWQFPQYTQTWAFTPPAPTPYPYPQPFDPKKYGDPLKSKDVKKNR